MTWKSEGGAVSDSDSTVEELAPSSRRMGDQVIGVGPDWRCPGGCQRRRQFRNVSTAEDRSRLDVARVVEPRHRGCNRRRREGPCRQYSDQMTSEIGVADDIAHPQPWHSQLLGERTNDHCLSRKRTALQEAGSTRSERGECFVDQENGVPVLLAQPANVGSWHRLTARIGWIGDHQHRRLPPEGNFEPVRSRAEIRGPRGDFLELRARDFGRPPVLAETRANCKAKFAAAEQRNGTQPQSPAGPGSWADAVRNEPMTSGYRVAQWPRIRRL